MPEETKLHIVEELVENLFREHSYEPRSLYVFKNQVGSEIRSIVNFGFGGRNRIDEGFYINTQDGRHYKITFTEITEYPE